MSKIIYWMAGFIYILLFVIIIYVFAFLFGLLIFGLALFSLRDTLAFGEEFINMFTKTEEE